MMTAATPSLQLAEAALGSMRDYSTLQEVVKLTFTAFHDVLKAQSDAIKTLERALETKASKSELAALSHAKANASDVEMQLQQVNLQLKMKPDRSQAASVEDAAALSLQLSDLKADMAAKVDAGSMKGWREHSDRLLKQVSSDVAALAAGLQELQLQMSAKASYADVSQALAPSGLEEKLARKASVEQVQALEQQLAQHSAAISAELLAKADRQALEQVARGLAAVQQAGPGSRSQGGSPCGSPRGFSDLGLSELALKAGRTSGQVVSLQGQVQALQQDFKEVQATLSKSLRQRATTVEVNALSDKFQKLQAALALKADSDAVAPLAGQVAKLAELGGRVDALGSSCEEKANVEDVNAALVEVCRELDAKAPAATVPHSSHARWLWKSGRCTPGGAVPWNVQVMNSAPEALQWEQDKATIVCALPGLYEVSFGFYGRRKPVAQLMVNGEPTLLAANKAGNMAHSPSSGVVTSSAHSAGHVTGLTCLDFLSLPAGAKLRIELRGDERAEGFLSLKKL